MQIRVLGPVEASVDDRPVALGAGKQRAVLAMLGARGQPRRVGRPADRGAVGRASRRRARPRWSSNYVWRLRKALRAATAARRSSRAGAATSCGSTASWSTSDARAAGREARWPRRTGDARARRSRCGAARRSPTSPTSRSRRAEIRRLEELRLTALELAIDADLAAGRHHEVVGELEALRGRAPAARAPARAADARAVPLAGARPRRWRPTARRGATLVEEIGVEPGPELRRLHEAILRQDPALDRRRPTRPSCRRELDARRRRWSGREAELRAPARAVAASARRRRPARAGRAARTGSARRGWRRSWPREVHRDAAPCSTRPGRARPETALAALAARSGRAAPTLLVLDDVDRAGERGAGRAARARPSAAGAAGARAGHRRRTPALAAGCARTPSLSSAPLDAAGVRAIAGSTRPNATAPRCRSSSSPRRAAACRSGCTRAAAEWARALAARRVDRRGRSHRRPSAGAARGRGRAGRQRRRAAGGARARRRARGRRRAAS